MVIIVVDYNIIIIKGSDNCCQPLVSLLIQNNNKNFFNLIKWVSLLITDGICLYI